MMIARVAAVTMACLGMAACAPVDMDRGLAAEPPCPNVISEREAVRIARELAHSQITEYGGADAHANWNDPVWVIFLAERGRPSRLMLTVRADGHLIDCGIGVQCEPDSGVEVPACGAVAGNIVNKQVAGEIALNYVARNNLTTVPLQVVYISWYDAHWYVRFTFQGLSPVDSDFTVFVSSDGSRAELAQGDMGVPQPGSFLFQEPKLE